MGILSGLFDVPGWFKSDAQTALDSIPDYQKRAGEQGYRNASQVNELAMMGTQPETGNSGPLDAKGKPMSVPTMFANNINQGYSQLGPQSDPIMAEARKRSNMAVDQAQIANNQAQTAQGQSMAAAGQVAGAGADARGNVNQALGQQFGQAGQYGQDLGIIRNSAMGNGPSAAAQLAKQQLDASIQAQASQAGQARGGNIAAGMRSAANAGTQIQLQGAQQMAAQRAQEQLNAQGLLNQGNAQLGQTLNAATTQAQGVRQQDIGQAVAGANATNEAGKLAGINYGTTAGLAGQGLGNLTNLSNQWGNQSATQVQAEQNAQQQYADWLQKQYSISSGIPAGQFGGYASIAGQSAAQNTQSQGALLQAGATALLA